MRRFINILLIIFLLILLPSCSRDEKSRYPVPGLDPLKEVGIMEDHSEALVRWMKKGIRKAILINVDTHDDIRWIPVRKVKRLAELYRKQDWQALERANSTADEGLYNVGNFIYAAAKLGIIRELYWVIPYAKFSTPDPLGGVKKLLETYSFPEESIRSFALIDGCARGSFYNIPVSICGIERLPEIREPVILSFDIDFYPPMPVDYRVDRATSIRILFQALFRQNYKLMDTVVAYSVRGGYLRPYQRWMGDATIEILKKPTLINSMPETWSILSAADYYLKQEKYTELAGFLEGVRKKYPSSLPIDSYLAFGYLGQGRYTDALSIGKSLCDRDINYCYILTDMGVNLSKDSKPDKAAPFFRYAYEKNPEIDYGQIYFANALRKAGRFEEAIRYYQSYRKMNGAYPVDMIIGETYLMMGDEKKAGEFFDSGREALKKKRYVDVKNEVVSSALRSAVRFYEKTGQREFAEEIRNDRRISDLL